MIFCIKKMLNLSYFTVGRSRAPGAAGQNMHLGIVFDWGFCGPHITFPSPPTPRSCGTILSSNIDHASSHSHSSRDYIYIYICSPRFSQMLAEARLRGLVPPRDDAEDEKGTFQVRFLGTAPIAEGTEAMVKYII